MSYRDEYHPKVKHDLKKLDKILVKELFDIHIEKILRQPEAGERLHGDLEGVSAYHFRKNKIDYRIAYTVEESEHVIYFVMVGKRENFYEILRRRSS